MNGAGFIGSLQIGDRNIEEATYPSWNGPSTPTAPLSNESIARLRNAIWTDYAEHLRAHREFLRRS